jgi:hypothetical protein
MGKHTSRGIRQRRRILVVSAVVVVAVGAAVAWFARGHDPLVRPPDTCADAPPLRTFHGVTLQPAAMRAFKKAERLARGGITVVQSYRSCAQQAEACQRICGNVNGCPGRCVKPGHSYHQLGAAIDVSEATLRTEGVVAALEQAGWCESVPSTDPGHFSFDGCH